MAMEQPLSATPQLLPTLATTMLLSGGDERLTINPHTGLNRYLTSPTPRDDEGRFSSSTANTITHLGFQSALADLNHLLTENRHERTSAHAWIETQRTRLRTLFGNKNSDVVFAGSGTDAELLALSLATLAVGSPITNILAAPDETGSGVPFAARGEHFQTSSPFGGSKPFGHRLDGFEHLEIVIEAVTIRQCDGKLRPSKDVDDDAFRTASVALAKGHSVLFHLLDVSKTGSSGPSVEVARQISALAPGRVAVVVDCCQLRSSAAQIREYADEGFLVVLTGSKFAGGPPFSGAMIVPNEILDKVKLNKANLPTGLRAFTALLDWPEHVRPKAATVAGAYANIGLALRWSASLREIDRFNALPLNLAKQVAEAFDIYVRKTAESSRYHCCVESRQLHADWARTIIPVAICRRDGAPASLHDARKLQLGLLDDSGRQSRGFERRFHVGQPVMVGENATLRVCISAPMISDIVERIARTLDFERELAPLKTLIDDLFWKSEYLIAAG